MKLIERIQTIEQSRMPDYKHYTLMQKGSKDNAAAFCYFPDKNELREAHDYGFNEVQPSESTERRLALESYVPLSKILGGLVANNELDRLIVVVPGLEENELNLRHLNNIGRTISYIGQNKTYSFLRTHFLAEFSKYIQDKKFSPSRLMLVKDNETAQEHLLKEGNTVVATYTSKSLKKDLSIFGPGN